jgi:hypothetical protein
MMLYIAKLGLHEFLLAVSGNIGAYKYKDIAADWYIRNVPSLGIVQQLNTFKTFTQILALYSVTFFNKF